MFWDRAASMYELFENIYNGDVNRRMVEKVSEMIGPEDRVLECACGTGMISRGIAKKCRELVATDFSAGMLRQARKNLKNAGNVRVRRADIMALRCRDEAFDKVVAGNVIHLLDDPAGALEELLRVCRPGGEVIIPTYINNENSLGPSLFVKLLERFGADFKKQFDRESYRAFFESLGHSPELSLVEGKMPCAIAVIRKN